MSTGIEPGSQRWEASAYPLRHPPYFHIIVRSECLVVFFVSFVIQQAKAQTRKEKAKQSLRRADRSELSSESKPLTLDTESMKNSFCRKPSTKSTTKRHSQSGVPAKSLPTTVIGERKNHDGKTKKPVLSDSPPVLADFIAQAPKSSVSRLTSVKPMTGIQLQLLPHFGEMAPPFVGFSENSGMTEWHMCCLMVRTLMTSQSRPSNHLSILKIVIGFKMD